jgi:hypothetical protein
VKFPARGSATSTACEKPIVEARPQPPRPAHEPVKATDLEEGKLPNPAPPAGSGSHVISATWDEIKKSTPNPLAKAPVVIVTKTEIMFRDKLIVTIADAMRMSETRLATLAAALGNATPNDSMLILQADASTPMKVINLVINTAKSTNRENVLFAVKNKS